MILASANSWSDVSHATHRKAMAGNHFSKSMRAYQVQDLGFVGKDGQESVFGDVIDTNKPVILNFIFTTCTTICPIQTATFAQVQRKLGEQAEDVIFVSVSIDPEHDTPSRLREYSEQFNAGPQWQFLTGSVSEMIDIQKAFHAYHGAKMNHRPLTLIKVPDSIEWIRLEGMVSAADIVAELERITSTS
jgi:protein SCO1/2